jgi:hypothetical protein
MPIDRDRARLGAVRATGRFAFDCAGGADREAERAGALRAAVDLALALTAAFGRRAVVLRAGALADLRGAALADRPTLARAAFFAVRLRTAAFRAADRPRPALRGAAAAFRRVARAALRLAIAVSLDVTADEV